MTHAVTTAAYNPGRLLDALLQRLHLTSDSALAQKLNVRKNLVLAIRRGQVPVAASMLLWMQEATGISIAELRALMGDRRAKCRPAFAIQTAR